MKTCILDKTYCIHEYTHTSSTDSKLCHWHALGWYKQNIERGLLQTFIIMIQLWYIARQTSQ